MRYLALILLFALPASAQISDGITTTVSRTVAVTPDEADFVVVVSTSLDTTRDQVTQAFQNAGIQNLTVIVVAAGPNTTIYPPPNASQLYYQIAFTTAPAALPGYTGKLDAIEANLPSALSSLQYSAYLSASQTAVDAAHQATLPQLLQDERTKAQALANAASLKLGAITGVTEASNAAGGYLYSYAIVPAILSGSFSSSGTNASTQYTFYATVKFAAQ